MNEKENLNNQLFKHMKLNIIAFAIIFILFGIFIFQTVSRITYKEIDKELLNAIDEFRIIEYDCQVPIISFNSNLFNNNDESNIKRNSKYNESILGFPRLEIANQRDYFLSRKIRNPKIVFILRDAVYDILNTDDLGIIYDNYFEELTFDSNSLNKIYEITLDGKYHYRAINLKLDYQEDDNQDRYIQLLINVDSERNLLDSYMQIIISATLFGIALSIIASYILSKRTLIPIKETIERQSEFVENVSHELRTPLTIIQAKQELLLQEPKSRIMDKIEDISLTLEETKRLSKLTKDLLILTRADYKNMTIQKEEVEIDKFIENLAKPYIEFAEIQEKKIILDLMFNQIASIDVNKLHQVIVILLDNSLKYTECGDTITISTYLKENKCVIEVKDTGIGISDEGIKRVFDRFYREDKTRNREKGGFGLGLAIAYSVVKAHNGSIKASHNKPKGTIFTIRLPK